jgi:Fur family ferric uptake transcriptional regulator
LEQKKSDELKFQRTRMQKESVLKTLKDKGCRITNQRKVLLDVILDEECTSCKEIYYKAVEIDPNIGAATVYRMVNLLEDIGAISRRNIYKISCNLDCVKDNACTIELDDNMVYHLSRTEWNSVIMKGLKACGYLDNQKVNRIVIESEKNA